MQQIAQQGVLKWQTELEALSQKIWAHPEGPFQEEIAAQAAAQLLEKAGFTVERNWGGIKTAIRAQFGTSAPVIGFLGEYDALPDLSQESKPVRSAIAGEDYGHGCGHNLLGAAAIGGALGMAEVIRKTGKGTAVFYGCPAEEALVGKAVMASKGAFTDLDLALVFHPSRFNRAVTGTFTGVRSMKFHFHGKTAHAAGDPQNGRSALDAVELTNVGANYLREHIPPDVRLHYVITNGGTVPNVVPDKASVWYYIRALDAATLDDVYTRLGKVAYGASIMTETQLETEFFGGCYPTAFSHTLADTLDRALSLVPQPEWTEDEIAFAAALNQTDVTQFKKAQSLYQCTPQTQMFSGKLPIYNGNTYGSTDVGDVSYLVPTGWVYTACYNLGAPGHSWQVTSCAGSSIGKKGMMHAASVLAAAAAELIMQPQQVIAAKEEFATAMAGQVYTPFLPDNLPI